MIDALLNFSYVDQMDPRAALHMGILVGASFKKALDFSLQKYSKRKQNKSN